MGAAREQKLDLAMTALGDATRRAIIRRLQQGDARVTEIAAPFPMSLNAVSKHVKVLERAQLVRRRKVGRAHVISFNPAPLEAVSDWVSEMRAFWADRLDALERALEADDEKKQRRKS